MFRLKGITHLSRLKEYTYQSSTPQYSFYTCRYLHILIYIPDSSSNSDPARSIGVDG